jgi:hypothetical protein
LCAAGLTSALAVPGALCQTGPMRAWLRRADYGRSAALRSVELGADRFPASACLHLSEAAGWSACQDV